MKDIHYDLSIFRTANNTLIGKNENAWNSFSDFSTHHRVYTLENVTEIIEQGSLEEQEELSKYFYDIDGFYKRIILYYATLLKYCGLLTPNPRMGVKLSNPTIHKLYIKALRYIEHLHLPEVFTRISLKALIDGCYYGVIKTLDRKNFTIIDLPSKYCRSRFKDIHGNDLIEFNVNYFSTIFDGDKINDALKSYPKVISSWYKKYLLGKVDTSWVLIPSDIGVCFPFFDDNKPLFLSVIPASMKYDDAVDTERERELEEIRKIIVQKVPHLNDGQLVFEPPEALEMHAGTVQMLKGNKNLSVLTTYADVDSIVSKTSNEGAANTLEKMQQNIYSEAGASINIFSPTGTQALGTSINNDMALMMILGNKYSRFITYIINTLFSNGDIDFKYEILPVSYYNQDDYITSSLKMAQLGYSFLVPAIASGMSQYSLVNIKELENSALNLRDQLIPLSSSYTQSSNIDSKVGAPEKKDEDKSPKTIQNENAIDNQ